MQRFNNPLLLEVLDVCAEASEGADGFVPFTFSDSLKARVQAQTQARG